MDVMDLNDSMESDFISLLENAKQSSFPQDVVEDSAEMIVGEDWREVGKDILEDAEREDLMETFEKYANQGSTEED